jgi:hypothetical protein
MLHLADAPEHATDAATFTALHYAPTMTVSPEALARPAAALAAATFVLRDALRPVVPPAAAGEQALIHLGRLPVETARRLDLRPETGIARIVGPDAARLALDGVPTPAGMQVLANGVLEILPAREAFRPADGRIHREAAAAFDARGIVARADADPRVAPLPPPAGSPAAVASSWAGWLLRLAIGSAASSSAASSSTSGAAGSDDERASRRSPAPKGPTHARASRGGARARPALADAPRRCRHGQGIRPPHRRPEGTGRASWPAVRRSAR